MKMSNIEVNPLKSNLNSTDSCDVIVIEDEDVIESTILSTDTQKNITDNEISQKAELNFYSEINGNSLKTEENEFQMKSTRILRKRIRSETSSKKTYKSVNKDQEDVEKYYLNKKVKRAPSNLETIFEEPKILHNNDQQYLSTRKYKRTLCFSEDLAAVTRLKLRKRRTKAKKLASSKKFLNRKRISLEKLKQKLKIIESDRG